MGRLVKKVVTEVTFRENVSEQGDVRYLKLRYDSEGAGRYFVLTDESNFDGRGCEIHLSHPDDFLMLYEAAKEIWDQGSIYVEDENW